MNKIKDTKKKNTRIKKRVDYSFSSGKIYTILLLFIITVICFEIGYNRAITVDFYPINGDFQNYNVWRRFLDGQVPYKDFPVYLGMGHLVLGSLLTGIFGNTFRMSLVASHVLTAAISTGIVVTISYLILKNMKVALTIATSILVIVNENFKWLPHLIYKEFWIGLNTMLKPSNSARIIRGGIVIFVIWGVLLALYLISKNINKYEKLGNKQYNMILVQLTCLSAISGIGVLYSNDIGISSYICFSFVYFILLIKRFGFKAINSIIKYTIFYIIISFITAITVIFIITRGNIGAWFEFTFSAGQYQSWYYGLTESWKTYYIKQLRFSPLSYIAILLVVYNIYKIFRNKNIDTKEQIYEGMITYILLTGLVSSILVQSVSGVATIELLSLCTFTATIAYICKIVYSIFKYKNLIINKKISYICGIIVVLFSSYFTVNKVHDTYINSVYNKPGEFVKGLDGNLTALSDDINSIVDYTGKEDIFSTYASAVETIKGDFQPTGTDYIIHVLGDRARENYVQNFLKGKYKYVQTINRDYTVWELWAESANWFFYKELYKNYYPTLTTSYSVIWEPVSQQNIIDADVAVNVEKLSVNEYKITCTTDSDVNAIADLCIGYKSNFLNGFLHNGAFRKDTHITDITKNKIYNSEYVNYFIPAESEGYSIPVTILQGVGEIIISSYPQKDSSLDIYSAKVNEVLTNPFLGIHAANMTDINWTDGVSINSNTILLNNSPYIIAKLESATVLKSGNTVAKIESVQILDDWIHVTLSGDKEAFSYPNKIEAITE